MNADRMNGIVNINVGKSAEKLSSGYRINRASDDAAGLAMSEKMRRQVRGLTQASFNAQDGISMVQTAEGALNEVHDMLQRMNELCVKAANETMTYEDRENIQDELSQISEEFDRIGETTTFNEIKLLDGPLTVSLQVGSEAEHTYSFELSPVNAATLEVDDIDVKDSDGSSARVAIDKIKNAIDKNSQERANLGSVQNRLEHIIRNLDNVVENTTASESKLRDTDMASEMQYYSNTQIIAQAGQSLMAQANQSKQGVLTLLG
jgi:flagellin